MNTSLSTAQRERQHKAAQPRHEKQRGGEWGGGGKVGEAACRCSQTLRLIQQIKHGSADLSAFPCEIHVSAFLQTPTAPPPNTLPHPPRSVHPSLPLRTLTPMEPLVFIRAAKSVCRHTALYATTHQHPHHLALVPGQRGFRPWPRAILLQTTGRAAAFCPS